jgi:signal transduction histidine kinase
MSSLPADYPTSPIRRARPASNTDAGIGSDLRGVLHDVGHGLFTLSLLLDAARGALLPQLGDNAFDLVEEEVAQLLAMVHGSTRRSAEPTPVGLRTLLEPFALMSRRTTLTKVWLRPGPESYVCTDPGMVWRIVANLVDNAIRAAGPLGNVEIVAEAPPNCEYAMIDVIDDGPGFQRGPSGLANRGLTVVNRLLAACGGRLRIHEVAPHGTRMQVLLPRDGHRPPVGMVLSDGAGSP